MNKKTKNVGILVALVSAFSVTAEAQEAEGDEVRRLEEIVVTAQRREQTVLDTPMGITAFSEESLEALGTKGFEDYARFTPGLSFIHRGEWSRSFQPNIRGVQLSRTGPTTAFYLDDMPLQPLSFARAGLPDPDMFDVNRVEVLKGPQGTLYGANAMGGAIKVVPNAPDMNEYSARVATDFNQISDGGSGYEYSGMINLPLIDDKLALRAVGTISQTDGWIRGVDGLTFVTQGQDLGFLPGGDTPTTNPVDNLENIADDRAFLNDDEFYSFRVAIDWRVNDQFTLKPRFFTQEIVQGHGRQISGEFFEASGGDLSVFPVFGGQTGDARIRLNLASLTADYEFDWGNLTGIATSYDATTQRESPYAGFLARSGVPLDRIASDLNQPLTDVTEEDHLIAELRASTDLDGSLNGTVGLFWRDVERDENQITIGAGWAEFLGTDVVYAGFDDDTLTESAIFGELMYQVTDKVIITAGIRAFDYDRGLDRIDDGLFGGDDISGASISESGTNFSGSINYAPTDTLSIYSRVSDGVRPGTIAGFTAPPECVNELVALGIDPNATVNGLDSDSLTNYEAGIKTRLFNNQLSLNLSAYYIDWDDVQVDIRLDCSITINDNAGQASIQGMEFDGSFAIGDNWDANFAVGIADSELDEDAPALGGTAGDPLPEVSELTASAGLQYSFDGLGQGVSGYVRADVSYGDQSLYNFRISNPRRRDIKEELTLVNLKFAVNYEDLEFSLFAKNALNDIKRGQCRDSSLLIPGERITCTNVPRTIGVGIGRQF